MGKINIAAALTAVKEESFIPHPYWGYKCSRGLWLTRFPREMMPEDPAFMLAFIEAGGNLDAMGHWGETPDSIREKEEAGWSLHEIALFGKGVPADLCGVIGLDETNWKIYRRGLNRADALEKNQIELSCSVWTLGRKSLVWFLKKLFSKGFRVTRGDRMMGTLVINHYVGFRPETRICNKYADFLRKEAVVVENLVNWNASSILPEKFLAYCRKCGLESPEVVNGNIRGKLFVSEKAAEIFARIACKKMKTWGLELTGPGGTYRRFGKLNTREPLIRVHEKIFVHIKNFPQGYYWEQFEGVPNIIKTRQVAGFNVFKAGTTWYLWKIGQDFSTHMESYSGLHAAIEMAEKREKKNFLILTLNDVRNDRSGTAGFCLEGTKNFLQNRMPHVYRLVAKYSSWAEVPEEIATIEWHLTSKSIFEGYSSPVN